MCQHHKTALGCRTLFDGCPILDARSKRRASVSTYGQTMMRLQRKHAGAGTLLHQKLPTSVEPVKESFLTIGSREFSANFFAAPVITLKTPFRHAARSRVRERRAEYGVCPAGSRRPCTRGYRWSRFASDHGQRKIQGVMHATTPIGCLIRRCACPLYDPEWCRHKRAWLLRQTIQGTKQHKQLHTIL